MRDGTVLRADVFRPDSDGQYPCLVARSLWIVEPIVFTPTVMDSFDSSLGAIVFQRDPAGHPIGMMLNAGDASHVALVKITSGCTD